MAGQLSDALRCAKSSKPSRRSLEFVGDVDLSGDTVKISDATFVQASARTSDETVATAIALLAQSSIAELRFLRVDESEHEICLSGRVRSFYHKQLAQETIRPIAAGRQVINRVNVGD